MAEPVSHNHSKTLIMAIAGAALVLLIGLFVLGSGHNNGQPSAAGGPGNPMRTDQGR